MSDVLQRRLDAMGRAQLDRLGFDVTLARKVAQRIREGLDAKSVKVLQHEGVPVYGKPLVDFTERRLAAELCATLFDWKPNKLEHEVHGEVGLVVQGLDGSKV